MDFIGITERGDAGLDFSWVPKLYKANIIISKTMNNKFIEHLVANKDRIILHQTCTGWGSSALEPHVPGPAQLRKKVEELIAAGFPARQIVLRIDPTIPTRYGLMTMEMVLQEFASTGIKRVRYSFLDMYDHVKLRFKEAGFPIPYESFHAPKEMIDAGLSVISNMETTYEFESCAETNPKHKLGCVSEKDLDILGVKLDIRAGGFQRKLCACLDKKELLSQRKQCPHGCLYCFWKDK